MMLPLTAERPGDNWPRTLDVRTTDGHRLTADVVWISAANRSQASAPAEPAAKAIAWTDDPRHLRVRGIEREDDTSKPLDTAAGEGPYLLLRLPSDGQGPLRIEGVEINPLWRDVPWSDPLRDADAAPLDGVLKLEAAPDRPDPDSPFEYWRWVLLADRMGLNAPPPGGPDGGRGGGAGGDDQQRLVAEHYAVLWRIGFDRLARGSRRIATECRDMLARTALDRSRPVATWITDPQQIATLLGGLLDFSRPDSNALSAAVAWLDQQPRILLWPENESGDQVLLAITSLRSEAVSVQFTWQGSNQAPYSLQLEPGVIAHVSVNRLPLQPSPILGPARLVEPTSQVLRVQVGDQTIDLTCGPRVIEARPPGISFRALSAPISLNDVARNRAPQTPPERCTLVQVRRLSGRWEVFFECRRNLEAQQTIDRASLRTYDDLRGIEAVTLLLGRDDNDDGGPAIWLTIPEHDWPAVVRGASLPDLQVHKRSFGDRWNCRVVLPDQWFSAAQTNPAFVAFIRSHADNPQLETGPAPCPPWRIAPGNVAIDLSHWDDLPKGGE